MLDEFEEWNMMLSHYYVSLSIKSNVILSLWYYIYILTYLMSEKKLNIEKDETEEQSEDEEGDSLIESE